MACRSAPVVSLSYSRSCISLVRVITPPPTSRTQLTRGSLAPIAWPIAKLLDHVLGKSDVHTYKKAELKSFLQFHRTGEEPLRDDEICILNGVLELNTKKVERIMTPMKVGHEAATEVLE